MISFFLPSYNHSDYILETLLSIESISLPGKHVFIVDDGSIDNSVDVINDYLLAYNGDTDYEFKTNIKNMGIVHSLNRFLDAAKCDYVMLFASDDQVIAEGVLAAYKMITDARAKFFIGNCWNLYPDGSVTEAHSDYHESVFSKSGRELYRSVLVDCPSPILAQGAIIEKNALLEIGGWDRTLACDDYVMYIRLFEKYNVAQKDFMFNRAVYLAYYRQHNSNSHINLYRQYVNATETLAKISTPELKKEALYRKFGFYVALCLGRFSVRDLVKILYSGSLNGLLLGLKFTPSYLLRFALNKCRR